ncbi:MAG TPA: glycoside hydrolase family 88 protein [Tepidisphaeraceae bacterium]|jgi:rhamnogalacturonyl hydrolase YesR
MKDRLHFSADEQNALIGAIKRIAGNIMAGDFVPVSPTNDLALESLLRAGVALDRPAWTARVAAVMRRRQPQPWEMEPLGSLTYAWADHTRDAEVMSHFVDQSYAMRNALRRSEDGLIQHPRGENFGGGLAVLIDTFAEYVSRSCRAAAWGDAPALADDAADQVTRHEKLLVHEQSGLWRQGRGWLIDPAHLSPGTWSRGQGYLMRGFADALATLPPSSAAQSIIAGAFARLADAVLARQNESGAWHALPHLPLEDSGPESSGTALIAYGLLRGLRLGVLEGPQYADAAKSAVNFVATCVDAEGIIHRACYGPGPLIHLTPWRVQNFPPGDSHGRGTVLSTLTAAMD